MPSKPAALIATLIAIASLASLSAQERQAPPAERTGLVHRGLTALTLLGPALKLDSPAPAVSGLRGKGLEATEVSLADGKIRVFSLVPSIDTPTCSLQTITFNERATKLDERVQVVIVSRDLPYAQERFCAAEGIDRVRVLSDYADGSFGRSWGLQIKETALLARAVVVVDGKGVVRYQQIVADISEEPDYDAALQAVDRLLGK